MYGNEKRNDFTFVALENVTDPRNIGSIIRSAASFNIDGLIFKDRHFPANSKLMYKSASGSIEHLNIFTVSNINTTLNILIKINGNYFLMPFRLIIVPSFSFFSTLRSNNSVETKSKGESVKKSKDFNCL